MATENEILHKTSSRLFSAPSPDYISLDKIEEWLSDMDKKFPGDIQLKGISFDRASNNSFGFESDGSDFTVFAPSRLVPSQKDGAGKIQPPYLEIRNTPTDTLTPSQKAFVQVVSKGLELTPTNMETVLIDIATLAPSFDYFCEDCKDGSVMKGLATALESENLKGKKVVIRLLVGDPNAGEKDWLLDRCIKMFFKFDSSGNNPVPKISHPDIKLYAGFYSPDFYPKEDTDVQEVKTFVSKVMNSSILKMAGFANILQTPDLNKLVDDLLAKDGLKTVPSITWNHGKVLAVNGQTLMTGGMNYFGEYTSKSGHDICDHSVKIQGDAAVSGHRWADYFWKYLTKPSGTDRNSQCRVINLSKDRSWYNWEQGSPASIPDSHELLKSISEKKLETLTVSRLGDWHGSMKKIQYPVQIIDCVRDLILNLAWHKINLTEYDFVYGKMFLGLVGYLSDDNLTKLGHFQELGINPIAWASRFARTQAIQFANDSVVISQQLLVQCLSADNDGYKKFVYKANGRITGKEVDETKPINSVPWNVPWDGNVWPYELLIAFARALGNMSKSTKPNLSAKDNQFYKESKGLFIILTTDTQDGSHNDGWQDKTTFYELKRRLRVIMQNLPYQYGGIDANKIDPVLDTLLHFKRTSNSNDRKGHDLYNHSKLVVVDRKIMYVGSDNAYPGYNEEHGVWINDQQTIDNWLDGFLVDFWKICRDPTDKDRMGK